MKSNLAIIEDNAIFSPKVKSTSKPKVSTVAKGVKLPTLKEANPIFDRPYGTEGHTFGEALEHSATVYKSLVKQRKNQLEKLKEIGLLLVELRSISGASDKDYGKLVSKTPLGIMSRQDRSDAMWLATEWQNVQSFLKEMDISSGSAAYLRQKIAKSKKTDAAQSTEGTEEESVVEDNGSDEDSTVASDFVTEKATLVVDSEESFAESVKAIATQQGLDLAKVIAFLIKS
jgi:hypothetical protein